MHFDRTPRSWRRTQQADNEDEYDSIMDTIAVAEDAEGDDSEVDDLLCDM